MHPIPQHRAAMDQIKDETIGANVHDEDIDFEKRVVQDDTFAEAQQLPDDEGTMMQGSNMFQDSVKNPTVQSNKSKKLMSGMKEFLKKFKKPRTLIDGALVIVQMTMEGVAVIDEEKENLVQDAMMHLNTGGLSEIDRQILADQTERFKEECEEKEEQMTKPIEAIFVKFKKSVDAEPLDKEDTPNKNAAAETRRLSDNTEITTKRSKPLQ
jgi:hypothetical protein